MAEERYTTYKDFFPFYLREHSLPTTRYFHYFSAAAGVSALMLALFVNPLMIFLGPLAGYGSAWISHAFIEKNKPATFTYPGWSLMGDYHMTWLALTGKLPAALEDAGINVDGTPIAEAAE